MTTSESSTRKESLQSSHGHGIIVCWQQNAIFQSDFNRFFFCVRLQRYIHTFKYGNADAEELWDAIGEVGILATDCTFIRRILLTNWSYHSIILLKWNLHTSGKETRGRDCAIDGSWEGGNGRFSMRLGAIGYVRNKEAHTRTNFNWDCICNNIH